MRCLTAWPNGHMHSACIRGFVLGWTTVFFVAVVYISADCTRYTIAAFCCCFSQIKFEQGIFAVIFFSFPLRICQFHVGCDQPPLDSGFETHDLLRADVLLSNFVQSVVSRRISANSSPVDDVLFPHTTIVG